MAYQSYETYQKNDSKLLKGILIGAAVGAAVAMLDRSTRQSMKQRSIGVKDTTMNLARTVKDDPQSLTSGMKETFQSASTAVNDVVEDVKHLMSTVDSVKNTGMQAVEQVKGAGNEVAKIGSKLKDAGQDVKEHSKDTVAEISDKNSTSPTSSTSTSGPSYADLDNEPHVVGRNQGN
ncbi:hypothetical protein SAMN04488137_4061 [Fictibacillus solisalsi]|uniref:Gas vesicle protein n=1 Tax=Fictibacillus solisalsi TaxID=459525 RepID=A0A1H0AD45_9BACL|nr:hypothetical protein [Fictibacillus solisalsi]SDN31538.1 hypothetical protein SAMN04488137_4061 [Fictibacillus solisalsi]